MVENLYLAIEMDDGSVERLRIDATAPVFIGRDASCDVVLPSPEVSRRHLAVKAENGGVRLTDKSANGTFVGADRQRVHQSTVIVPPNVPIEVGPYRLRVLVGPMARPDEFQEATAVPGDGGAMFDPRRAATVPPSAQRLAEAAAHAAARSDPAQPAYRMPEPASMQLVAQAPVAQAPEPPALKPATEPPREHGENPLLRFLGRAPKRAPLSSKYGSSGTAAVSVETRRRIHRALLDHLDLASLDRNKMDERVMRPKVREALTSIVRRLQTELPPGTDIAALIAEMTHEALGLGPLEVLLADETVSEVMVVDPNTIFIERAGRIESTDLRFTDDDAVRSCIERIVTPLGRRIDESTPLVDARLKDGSRVNAVIPPLALRGPCITIRKFRKKPLVVDDLIRYGTLTDQMARFLVRAVVVKKNIVISGGTGSGKTTLLNVLSSAIPEDERVVTIEDAAELRLHQPHVVSLEAKPPNMEGRGEVTIRDLVKNALRMRPDRIVVGECRGGEALDMLQAMNTGHEGSMTTTHANSPREALARLETLALMSGIELPARAIREQIANSVQVVVQQARLSDGSRRITAVSEVVGIGDDGDIEHRDIFKFHRIGTRPDGGIDGEFRATGYLPSFIDDFITHGLVDGSNFL
jgi:pilus assembly protein CpaF